MLNIDSIDDPELPDETPNFAGGLTSFPPRAKLQPNQFYIGYNTMLNKAGVLQTRRGCSYLGTSGGSLLTPYGMGYLETAAGTKRLLAIDIAGTIKSYDGANWAVPAGFVPTSGNRYCMVQGNDKLYIASTVLNMRSWDGAAFVDLGGGATDAPRCKYIVWGTNRLIAAGLNGLPDTIAFSDILDPSSTHWSAANRIRVGAGDGDPITGIAMFSKTLLAVFKRNKAYLVDINPATSVANFVIDEVPGNIGCREHSTIAKVGKDLWFLSQTGVCSLARALQGDDSQVSAPLSLPVQEVIRTNYLQTYDQYETHAVVFEGKYILNFFAQNAASSDPTHMAGVLSFSVDDGVWEGRWTMGMMCPVVTRFADTPRLVFGPRTGPICYWRHDNGAPEVADDYEDDNYTGPSQPIITRIGTRGHTFGAEKNDKQPFALEVEFDAGNTADTATVKCIPDDGAAVTLSATVSPTGKQALTLLHQPPCRAMAIEVRSESKKLALRSVKLSAFANTMATGT